MSEAAPVVIDAPPADTPPVEPPPVEPAVTEPPAPEATPAAEPAAPAVEQEGFDALPAWAQKEIRDTRAEAAKYRTSAAATKPVAEVLGKFDEGSQARIVELLDLTATDPATAAGAWREIADLLEGKPAEPPAADPDADKPLTRADLERIQKERDDAKAAADATAAIEREAGELGYTPGTGDYVTLLWSARNEHGGDLKKAHEALEAKEAQIVEKYLAKKKAEAAAVPTAGSGTGAPPANDNKPRTFADADAAAKERLKQL